MSTTPTIDDLNRKIIEDYAPLVAAGLVRQDQVPQYRLLSENVRWLSDERLLAPKELLRSR